MVQLSVSEDQLTASVTLKYMRGPRTRLELINRQTGVVSDVFSEYRDSVSAFDVLTFSDDEIKSLVRRIFIKRGYATAQITGPSRLTDVNGDSVLRFFLQAGPLVTISTVDFAGDLPKERQDVFEALGLSPGVFSGAVPYVEEDLTRYRDRLLELFYEEGYTEAQVAEPVATYTSDGRSVRL
jgi:outer membrane protein assembly factor BamA